MKKLFVRFLICTLFSGTTFCGCKGVLSANEPVTSVGDTVAVKLEFSAPTKSSISPDENSLTDLNIYVFHDGVLFLETYSDNVGSDITLSLIAGEDFNIYILGNYGRASSNWTSEDEFRDNFVWEITDVSELDHVTPMAATYLGYNTMDGRTVRILMERLISRIGVRFTNSIPGSTLKLTSLRICQCPQQVFPFMHEGSRAVSTSDGDYATASDIQRINEGGFGFFYTFENARGCLLPGNNDPWSKTADNLPSSIRDLCTYIELGCSFTEGSFQEGDIYYRIYPGADATSDFSIMRNTESTISVEATPAGQSLMNWKIDNFSMYTDGHASLSVADGMHDNLGELYIGETLTLDIDADDLLVEYFFEDFTRARLCLLNSSYEKDQSMVFSNIRKSGSRWLADCRCAKSVTGAELWIMDEWGNLIQNLATGVNIQKPNIILSQSASVATRQVVTSAPALSTTINSSTSVYYIYLTDSAGKNLGGEHFDNSLITLTSSFGTAQSTFNPLITMYQASITANPARSTYYGDFRIDVTNSGTSSTNSRLLADAISSSPMLLRVIDNNLGISKIQNVTTKYLPIEVDYDCVDRAFSIYNPSRLDLNLAFYDLSIFTGQSGNAITNLIGASRTYSGDIRSHNVIRYDAVSSNSQSFGCSAVQSYAISYASNSSYTDVSQDMEDHLFYAQFLQDNSGSNSFSRTWTVADVALLGRATSYKTTALSTSTESYCTGPYAAGEFEGLAVFSRGDFVCASDGLSPSSDRRAAVSDYDQYVVYSPATASALRSNLVIVSFDPIEEDNCTKSISGKIGENGEWTNVTVTYEFAAAVKTYPNGTGRDAQHFWAAPSSYLSSLHLNTDQSIYTSSNLTVNPKLKVTNTLPLMKGILTYDVVPMKTFIDAQIFKMTSPDSYNLYGSANSYNHQFHPISCSILATMKTETPSAVYRCNLTGMMTNTYYYKNTNYTGPSSDSSTKWSFRNTKGGYESTNAVSAGTCYLFDL